MESGNSYNDLRTASFAVYLSPPVNESFVKKLGDSSQYTASSREDIHLPLGSVKITTRDAGAGVFGSNKCFNRKVEDRPLRKLIDDCVRMGACKKEMGLDRCASISKSRSSVTTCASSESGWNIRSALSRGFRKNPTHDRQGSFRFIGRGFFRRLGCNKSCSDEESLHVREEHSPKRPPQQPILSGNRDQTKEGLQCSRFSQASSTGSRREDLFAFPMLGEVPHRESKERRSLGEVVTKEVNEDPRHSIEVFGSSHKDKKRVDVVALNLERKLSILTWDAIPKPYCPKASPRNSSILNDDQESEASSDLFEIENISGTANIATLFAPHPPDRFSGYEPSEASIEWSVITASAADFSAISEYDEKEVPEINSTTRTSIHIVRAQGEREGSSTRPVNGLLGFKGLETVRVPRSPPNQLNPRLDSDDSKLVQ